jgi:uncharacterized protein YndB with AHSA1/START domain
MRTHLISRDILEDIVQTEVIRASRKEVFRALTDSRIIDEWGGGPARVQAKPNGRYSLWDGEMFGIVREAEFPTKFVHTLREASWVDGILDSLVTWTLKDHPRGTELTLRHSGLPDRKTRDIHEDGWGEYFLGPLKAYLERNKR